MHLPWNPALGMMAIISTSIMKELQSHESQIKTE